MSFQQGLSGLNAAAKNLDVIGNNIANSSTVGFKGSSALFADVFANTAAGATNSSIGIGTSVSQIAQSFTQGNIETTSNPLDVAINGQGFFRLSNNGALSYTRNGQFIRDKDGFFVTPTGQYLTGYPPLPDGSGVSTSSPVNLQVALSDLAPEPTTEATLGVSLVPSEALPTNAPFDASDATTFNRSTSLSVYDSLGGQHVLSIYFAKTASNNWDVYAALDNTQVGGGSIGSMAFTAAGVASSIPIMNLNMPVTNGAANIAMTLDLRRSTQYSSAFSTTPPDQDGFPAGSPTGFSIAKDGMIVSTYSNGQTRVQGQIALSNFINPGGLQILGSNQWAETSESGQPATGTPGAGNLGVLQSGALESSNVDMTAELIDLITAQRVYQANAQTIKTQDSVLQTLVNLR
ncbi:MAG: flagellar hook protein FlgE [Burkholderiales bacterium]|nr:flagellar hook protein FlgE [Burkholderiales bacterium]